MAVFRWRHFASKMILWAVRWYCRYGISYRELEEMMGGTGRRGRSHDGVAVDAALRSTAGEGVRWYQGNTSRLLAGRRDVHPADGAREVAASAPSTKQGRTIDFLLTDRRNAKAAQRFLAQALRTRQDWSPQVINTDKNPAYDEALRQLKREDAHAKRHSSTVR